MSRPYSHVARVYDELAPKYDDNYRNPLSLAEDIVYKRLIMDAGANVGHVLDVGCGTGYFLDLFPHHPPESYVGVDISSAMLDRARLKHPEYTFFRKDANDIGQLGHDRFNAVVSTFVLSYVPTLTTCVEAIQRVLVRGGVFFVVLNAPRHARNKVYRELLRKGGAAPGMAPLYLIPAKEVALRFKRFADLKVTGFNYLGQYLPRRLGVKVLATYLQAEYDLMGGTDPNYAQYFVVTGRKP